MNRRCNRHNYINNYIKYIWNELSNEKAEMIILIKKQDPNLCSWQKMDLKYKDRMKVKGWKLYSNSKHKKYGVTINNRLKVLLETKKIK